MTAGCGSGATLCDLDWRQEVYNSTRRTAVQLRSYHEITPYLISYSCTQSVVRYNATESSSALMSFVHHHLIQRPCTTLTGRRGLTSRLFVSPYTTCYLTRLADQLSDLLKLELREETRVIFHNEIKSRVTCTFDNI